jgi:tetratricopeptide (TPR) repeat protein
MLYVKGDYQAAEEAVREALRILTQAPLTKLGLILSKTGRSREGEADLREALAIRTGRLPAGHQLIAVTEGALGECLIALKRYADAEPFLLRSHAAMKSNVGEKDPRTVEARGRLSHAL